MKIEFLKYYLFLFTLLLTNGFAYSQNPQDVYLNTEIKERAITKENWEKVIEGISYNEKTEKEVEDYDEDFSSTSSNNNSRRNSSSRSYSSGGNSSAFWAGFFKVFFILIIIATLALFVANLLGAGSFIGPPNRKIIKSDATITINNIEEHIYESDLDRFIREAVEQKRYALAIRLYYLAIIKELSLSRTIRWKKDKTNKDYLREMRKTNMFQPFREVTRIFERTWYGKSELKEADYNIIKPKFETLVKAAQSNQISNKPD